MGKTTEYLGLYEAADNDFYNVEKDQNENFTILDNKAKEVDEALLSAKGYTDGLAGNVIDSFPLSNATEGKVYREPQNKKYYICIKNYSGSQISLPNANFEELSVFKNHDRLNNLIEIKEYTGGNGAGGSGTYIIKYLKIKNYCVFSAEYYGSSKDKYKLVLPFKFDHPYASVTDNDAGLYTGNVVTVGWASDYLEYKGPKDGHTILIAGVVR